MVRTNIWKKTIDFLFNKMTSTTTFPTLTTQPTPTVATTTTQSTPIITTTTQPTPTIISSSPQITTISPQTIPGGTTVYTQPSIIPNTSYPYGWPYQYGYPYPYTQQPIQLTTPYGTSPIIMNPGSNLTPINMSGNDIRFINGKKCKRVVKLKPI